MSKGGSYDAIGGEREKKREEGKRGGEKEERERERGGGERERERERERGVYI